MVLTGWRDPDVALLLLPGAEKKSVLFVQPKNPEMEIWTGIRPGPKGAVLDFGVDEALHWGDLKEVLTERLQGIETLHYAVGVDGDRDATVFAAKAARRSVRHNLMPAGYLANPVSGT